MTISAANPALVHWVEYGRERSAVWRSENGAAAPKNLLIGKDTLKADTALQYMRAGNAILWRGDFHNARQLLQALGRRTQIKPTDKTGLSPAQRFHQLRMMQAQRVRLLGLLLIELDAGHQIGLRRAPDLSEACAAAYGATTAPYLVSLRELLGVSGAWEWRRKGVAIPTLAGQRIHAHYGVFSPLRGEYVDLVAQAPLPATTLAFDIGTGTGVLAAVLAQRGMQRVVATDQDERALACARENLQRLGFTRQVEAVRADLFPDGRAPLVVCNPPWLPGRPSSALEYAIYDPDGRMLAGFLQGLGEHLEPGGEGWLIMSDLAEHLQLRSRQQLLDAIQAAGLRILGRLDTRPVHARASDQTDPLHMARSAEVTSLWRLTHA